MIDVCTDIYVMMSSDLYGTCINADVIVMSHTNGCLPYGTERGYYCNPFGSVATVSADIIYSICNIFLIGHLLTSKYSSCLFSLTDEITLN